MADVRALLKAKRQEARISHPYATYTTTGQLKCTVCGAVVKHASAWEGHLGSKLHRTNVVRMREEERRQRELQEQQAQAQEEEEEEEEESVERAPKADTTGKRKAAAGISETPAEKKRKVEAQAKGPQSFPQDFFSDPSRAPASLLSPASDEEDEGEDETQAAPPTTSTKDTVVDLEYERFQRELLMSSTSDPTEAYARATVAAEPVPASAEIAGFPPAEPEAAEPEPPKLTEDEIRRKREEDERELIMDRLLEEERAQEDADTRVLLLKTKLENLRRKRELAKAGKAPK